MNDDRPDLTKPSDPAAGTDDETGQTPDHEALTAAWLADLAALPAEDTPDSNDGGGSAAVRAYAETEAGQQSSRDIRREPERNTALVTLQQSDPALAALIADGRAYVRCGCGFVAVSTIPRENREALQQHPCPNDKWAPPDDVDVPKSWAAYVFPWPAIIIAALIVYGVLVAMGKT